MAKMPFVTDDASERKLSSSGMKVIAAGLSRCATSSLQAAFESDLGFGPSMHFYCVLPHTRMLKLCYAAEQELEKEKRQKILHQIFDGYEASTDFPGSAFVDDLIDMYPNVKVVLNKRDSAEDWYRSITATLKFFSGPWYLATCWLIPRDYWHWKVTNGVGAVWDRRYGVHHFGIEAYKVHNQWVRDICKKIDTPLLEWQPADGWEPLCKFLEVPVPDKPFPWLNDEKTIQQFKMFRVATGLLSWGLALSIPAGLYWVWSSLKG